MRFVEPRWFDVHTERIAIGLGTPLRVLHLSDLHASDAVPFALIQRGVELGVQARPDLVCITGDFITDAMPNPGRYRDILAALPRAAPTFACLGNHDGGPWVGAHYDDATRVLDVLRGAGITPLVNTGVDLRLRGQRLRLDGLGDLWNDQTEPDGLLPRWGLAPDRTPRVLLCHNPDAKALLAHYAWDLLLCGHTHGGQLWLPGLGAPFAPVRDKTFIAGVYPYDNRVVHITKGIGNLYGLRFNCRPQVSILELS